MLPVIAIVGRPNVGKSTLFNRLTRSRAALVADMPGVTRDRQYGEMEWEGRRAILIDTGGLEEEAQGISEVMMTQTRQALSECDVILFMVDAQAGLMNWEREIARELRQQAKPIILLLNKIDGYDPNILGSDFFELGFSEVIPIAAGSGRGISKLMNVLEPLLPEEPPKLVTTGINVAVIGRPNVGKSTLINRILGEERVVVYDEPGTTRDSISIPFQRQGKDYTFIDTAGVRRRSKVSEDLEKHSVIRTMRALDTAHVVVFLVDAQENITDQDLKLLGLIIKSGRSLLIAVNKWDGLPTDQRDMIKSELDRRLDFVEYAELHYISAKTGTGVGDLFKSINAAYKSAMKDISTADVTRILETAIESHQPPLVRGRRIKLRFAHLGGINPPIIVIHGNQVDELPLSYQRFLSNYFRKTLRLVGTPVHIQLKMGTNPFEGKKNKLTERQVKRRQRLMKHVKGKK